jgi:Cytochrome oxidase complex assembly protein 1
VTSGVTHRSSKKYLRTVIGIHEWYHDINDDVFSATTTKGMIRVLLSTVFKRRETAKYTMKRQNFLCWWTTTAVALSSVGHAWVPLGTTRCRGLHTGSRPAFLQVDLTTLQDRTNQRRNLGSTRPSKGSGYITRLYSSSDNDEGFLSRIGKAAKNLLPKNLFGNEEEKNKLARKKEYRDEVSGGLEAMLKDAPLGVRMMGKLITPLVSSLASNLADAMAEQQRTTEGIMDDARAYLKGDPSVSALLGEAIQLGAPFSQSTSSSSINGQTQTRVELAMPVQGSRGSGTVRLLATQDGIAQLQLDASGRRLDVKLTRRGSASSSFGRSSPSRINGDDNIIEAEVIEKDTK